MLRGRINALLSTWMVLGFGMQPLLAGDSEPTWKFLRPSNTGVLGDWSHTIYVDDQDRPWVAAYDPFFWEGGMSRMNHDGTWTPISNVDYPVIPSHFFNDIVADANGIMWIGTDGGLLRFDPEVGPDSFELFDITTTPMPANAVFEVEIDPDGKIWLGLDAMEPTDPGSGGLARFDPVTGTWDVWTTASGLPWGDEWPGWDWIHYLAAQPDAGGGFTIWFGSYEMGMATYKDGVFHWFGNTWPPPDPMTPTGLVSSDPVDELGNMWIKLWAGLAKRAPDGTYQVVGYPDGLSTEVSMVAAASGGRALLGTYGGRAYLWDNGWASLGDWGSSHTYGFAEDSTGAFWVSGVGGAARFKNGSWQRYRLTNSGMLDYWVHTVTFDDAGNVYMNGNAGPGIGGYDVFDGTRWTNVNDHNYGFGPPWGLPGDTASALAVRANGNIAVAPGLLQGALEWDGSSYTYRIPQGYNVRFLVEDALGRLWGSDDYGIAYLVDEFGNFTTFPQGASELPGGNIGALIVDKFNPGYVLIACGFGVARTNGVDWIIYTDAQIGVPSGQISSVDQADDGTLWIGTYGSGIAHYDPVTKQSTIYTMADTTLPSNSVDHVIMAPDGSVWMSSFDPLFPYPGGVTHFDGQTWTTYTEENSPLPVEQIWDLETRAIPGGYELWVGTAGEAIAVLSVTPSLVFTDDFESGDLSNWSAALP